MIVCFGSGSYPATKDESGSGVWDSIRYPQGTTIIRKSGKTFVDTQRITALIHQASDRTPPMLLHIDPHSGIPIFRQLQDQIRMAILSGLWKEGDEVPATRALSESLGVNPMTISKVYSLLEMEGWLERRRGKPLVVKGRPSDSDEDAERIALLRDLLRPVAHRVRQLGISEELALREWENLIRQSDPSSDSANRPDSRSSRP